eukprot:6068179-Pleurochrysis_carterae.AAC.5
MKPDAWVDPLPSIPFSSTYSEPCALFVLSYPSFGCVSYTTFCKFMHGRGNDMSASRPRGQDFNEHVAYFIQSTAMVSDPWFWPVLTEVFEQAKAVLNDEIEPQPLPRARFPVGPHADRAALPSPG